MCADRYGTAPAKSVCEHFNIRTDWPVLVVEDTEDRISWFRQRLPQAVFAKSAEAALQAMSQQEFKVAFLDHDLHWMHADNTIFKGTGKELAKYMAECGFGGIVVIHSRHEEGAAVMKKYLPNARLAPFGSFEITSDSVLSVSGVGYGLSMTEVTHIYHCGQCGTELQKIEVDRLELCGSFEHVLCDECAFYNSLL